MRSMLFCAVVAVVAGSVAAAGQTDRIATRKPILLDLPQVRVFTADGILPRGIDREPAVVIQVDGAKAGTAVWADDPGGVARAAMPARVIIVEPKRFAASPLPESAQRPGEGAFTGMSFKTLFDNDRVAVIRARMDEGAREAFHTHASDTVVVHLSGGRIEDTAGGVTKVNRWKPGDVEFEARGSSHSARNVGGAVDVVLVTLKPQPASR